VLIWASVLLFVAAGAGLILARKPLAHLQSLLAGGSMPPGCVIAEGVAFLLLAALVLLAYRLGYLGEL
jgi:hypothetical protein